MGTYGAGAVTGVAAGGQASGLEPGEGGRHLGHALGQQAAAVGLATSVSTTVVSARTRSVLITLASWARASGASLSAATAVCPHREVIFRSRKVPQAGPHKMPIAAMLSRTASIRHPPRRTFPDATPSARVPARP